MLQYLDTQPAHSAADIAAAQAALNAKLDALSHPVVDKDGWEQLEQIEASRAAEQGLDEFKFASNAEMLEVIRGVTMA